MLHSAFESAEAVVAVDPILHDLSEAALSVEAVFLLMLQEAEPPQADTGALLNANARAAIAKIVVSFFKGNSF
jgi:hypothetical protein